MKSKFKIFFGIGIVSIVLILLLRPLFIAKASRELRGIDSNSDRVRDEVELEVDRVTQGSKKLNAAAMQVARVYQRAIERSRDSSKLLEDVERAYRCLEYLGVKSDEFERITAAIEAASTDSKERAKAYLEFNLNLNGHTIDDPPPERKDCDFDLENLEN